MTSYKEFDALLLGDKLTASFNFVLGLEVTKITHVSGGKQGSIVCRPSACPVADVVLEDAIKRTYTSGLILQFGLRYNFVYRGT
jgi:hypothetical protein